MIALLIFNIAIMIFSFIYYKLRFNIDNDLISADYKSIEKINKSKRKKFMVETAKIQNLLLYAIALNVNFAVIAYTFDINEHIIIVLFISALIIYLKIYKKCYSKIFNRYV